MKKILSFIIVIILVGCYKSDNSTNQTKIRIISLSPHITEIIYALDADTDLVAVTDFCKYPATAQKKESIGGLLNPNIEKIVNLKPTHLFGVPSHLKLNQDLSKFGLDILMMPNETLTDIQSIISIISDTLRISDSGKKLNESIQNNINQLKKDLNENYTAMLVIGREKGSVNNITVAGPNTYLNEIWNLVGGINIFSDLENKYTTVNIEEIIKRNPDIIIEFNMNSPEGITNTNPGIEWQFLNSVNAIKQKKIFEIGGNYSLIPGPRVVKLAKDLSHINKIASQKN